MNAPTTDGDAAPILKSLSRIWPRVAAARSVPRNTSARNTETMRWAKARTTTGVGWKPSTRAGAIGKKVLLRLLDAVFHFSARAVKLLVECRGRKALFGLAGEAFSGKVGDHETRILPFVEDLGFAHHPARAAPTLARAILKVLKAPAR